MPHIKNSFIGQYVTLSILKSLRNSDKVVICSLVTDKLSIDIPPNIIQVGPSSNTNSFDRKIYFKAQKDLSVHYFREDGQPQKSTLQNLKQVT